MADREVTYDEKGGTLLQHKYNAHTVSIIQNKIGGYLVMDPHTTFFIPYTKKEEWVVIE